jgi:beta-galactosidase
MIIKKTVVLILLWFLANSGYSGTVESFNQGWDFVRDAVDANSTTRWERVTLPHTARIEPLFLGNKMWRGHCVYRKLFTPAADWKDKKVFLQFEGAMHSAIISLEGSNVATHAGGYLPFLVDLSGSLKYGKTNEIKVQLDNRDDNSVPPGKPLANLDFAWYHGLYRNVNLIVTDKLHITDPVAENLPASGGVFVSYPEVTAQSAVAVIKVHLRNEHAHERSATVRCSMAGQTAQAQEIVLQPNSAAVTTVELKIANPRLWSPQSPNLYRLTTDILVAGKIVDSMITSCGIRLVSCNSDGFRINGKKMYLRGTNRHQEYPYLGYALSDAAQWRDAFLIKQAGFDLVRLSHYPQSPAFLDACDHYGIIVMEPIPGWQFCAGGVFTKRSLQNAQDMIRRDRNHASCVFWETSLNESTMPAPLLKQFHEIVGQECPGTISASHKEGPHDLFIPARQHTGGPLFWDNWKNRNKAIFTAEYGDWEYYADRAANFNQTGAKELKKGEATSRQRRSDTEKRLLQQALNFQESHNQNHRNPAMIGDANWLFNDYNRGYAPDHCTSGIVDIFRLPKFVYYFYQSQRDPEGEASAAPMAFVASFWTEQSPLSVRVFSNCDEIELLLNGRKIARQKPDQDQFSTHLNHPPFTFKLDKFEPGELKAEAYLKGVKVAEHMVKTPGKAVGLTLEIAEFGNQVNFESCDTLLVYARVVDSNGTLVISDKSEVTFTVEGAELISPSKVFAEAGIACAVIKTSGGNFSIAAESGTFARQSISKSPVK